MTEKLLALIYLLPALLIGVNTWFSLRDPVSLHRVGLRDALWLSLYAGALWWPRTVWGHYEDIREWLK